MKRTTVDLALMFSGALLFAYGAWARIEAPSVVEPDHSNPVHPYNLVYRPLMRQLPDSDAITVFWVVWGMIGLGVFMLVIGALDFLFQKTYRCD